MAHHKYGAKPQWINGQYFRSKKEAMRYADLLLLQEAKQISSLEREVPFDITAHGKKICKYVADFVYEDIREKKPVIEDAKGYQTPEFKLKWKLMNAQYGELYCLLLS